MRSSSETCWRPRCDLHASGKNRTSGNAPAWMPWSSHGMTSGMDTMRAKIQPAQYASQTRRATTSQSPSLQGLTLQSMPRQRLRQRPFERKRNGMDATVKPWHDERDGDAEGQNPASAIRVSNQKSDHFPIPVIAGLDPAIHAVTAPRTKAAQAETHRRGCHGQAMA